MTGEPQTPFAARSACRRGVSLCLHACSSSDDAGCGVLPVFPQRPLGWKASCLINSISNLDPVQDAAKETWVSSQLLRPRSKLGERWVRGEVSCRVDRGPQAGDMHPSRQGQVKAKHE